MVLIFSRPNPADELVEPAEHLIEGGHDRFRVRAGRLLGEADQVAEQDGHVGMALCDGPGVGAWR
jgi:hypothetical protein